jgi:mRNA interferase MazF
MPDQGEIVLVPVPFTDLSSQKRRPVIVISSDEYNRRSPDIVVVAMTSNPAPIAHSFTVDSTDLVAGSLNRPGTVRVDKIYAPIARGETIWQRVRASHSADPPGVRTPDHFAGLTVLTRSPQTARQFQKTAPPACNALLQ